MDNRFNLYRLYLKQFSGTYDEPKPFDNLDKLLNSLDKYFYDYAGYLVIAWDNIEGHDEIITSGYFDNNHYEHKTDKPKQLSKSKKHR